MDPFPAWFQKLLDEWDIRVLILVSLTAQLILIFIGGRRKNLRGVWIRVLVWCVYLLADSVAIFGLGKLSDVATNNDSCDHNNNVSNQVMVLWAPLLLLHLGGPDTITAYSVEDVKLWLRHALGLFMEVGLAIYVFLKFWTGDSYSLYILTFPLFIAGILKNVDRIWVLASTNEVFPQPLLAIHFDNVQDVVEDIKAENWDVRLLFQSYIWLHALSGCFAGSDSTIDTQLTSNEVAEDIWANKLDGKENRFKFFEFQLGFMYDALYTKAPVIYTTFGYIIRLLSLICVVATLIGFSNISKGKFSQVNVCITYFVLGGGAFLEVYAIVLVIYSDWAIVWMCKHYKRNPLVRRILRFLAPLVLNHGKRCASSLAQLNLLSLALYEEKPSLLHKILNKFHVKETFKAYMCTGTVKDLKGLESLVLEKISHIFEHYCQNNNWNDYYGKRDWGLFLRLDQNERKSIEWSIKEPSFDKRIIIWHMATNYCYYLDNNPAESKLLMESSKIISDYMMYFLVCQFKMLGDVTECDLNALLSYYAELMENIRKEGLSGDKAKVCLKMQEWEPTMCTSNIEGKNDGHALHYARLPMDACDLAKTLMGADRNPRKWDIISQVWLETLIFAASQSNIDSHLEQLRRGGEFLTQVWLLLLNHGLVYPAPRDILRPLFLKSNATHTDS